MENELGISKEINYVGFWKRVLATLIDYLIMSPVLIVYIIKSKYIINNRIIWMYLLYITIVYSYFIFFQVKFGGTLGKLIIRIRIINQEGGYISVQQSLLRNSINFVMVGFFFATMFVIYKGTTHDTLKSAQRILNFIPLLDVLAIVVNEKKRALHDFIANSYVVTNESRLQIIEEKIMDKESKINGSVLL